MQIRSSPGMSEYTVAIGLIGYSALVNWETLMYLFDDNDFFAICPLASNCKILYRVNIRLVSMSPERHHRYLHIPRDVRSSTAINLSSVGMEIIVKKSQTCTAVNAGSGEGIDSKSPN